MEKFLQIKEKKKKILIDLKEREEKVFGFEKKYKLKNHGAYTVIKPFPLSKVNFSYIPQFVFLMNELG